MTKYDVLNIVKKQLAIDLNCDEKDFEPGKIVVTAKASNPDAMEYSEGSRAMAACCFGGAAVFSVEPAMVDHFKQLLDGQDPSWIFDPHTLIRFNELLYLEGQNVGNMIQYYAPDPTLPKTAPICEVKIMAGDEVKKYLPEAAGTEITAVAAIMDGKIVGVAAAGKKSSMMAEIYVYVDEKYRGHGIASNIVALIKDKMLENGIIPFYGSAASHTISLSTGVSAGFFPCWTRLYSRPRTDEFLHIHDR